MTHDKAYYHWLVDTFTNNARRSHHATYVCLLEQMHRKAFYFLIDNDENRAGDGLYLRDIYLDRPYALENEKPEEGPCTFLEFLIGISLRVSEMMDGIREEPIDVYLWEFVDRLGLSEFTDATYDYDETRFLVDAIMTDFMDREYGRDGEGGLFPLHHPSRDQRDVEIWYQMSEYLVEKPEFFH